MKMVFKKEYVRYFVIGVVCFLALGAVYWGYCLYKRSVNEQAQQAFSLQLQEFEQLSEKATANQGAWNEMKQSFEMLAQTHKGSSYAPFMQAYAADAAYNAGDAAQAQELLEKAVANLDSSSPFYYLYATKLAVLQGEQGKAVLEELARNEKNLVNDYAWYQLWISAWMNGDDALEKESFGKLTVARERGSAWAEKAAELKNA